MSALSVNDPGDPRSHRYYAPRQRRVVAREATLQPVLERLRGSTRDYSADERLGGAADPVALPEPEFVLVPDRRISLAAIAAFAGGATAVTAVAVAYIIFGTSGVSPAAETAPSAPAVAQAPAAPAKIDARVTPNRPVSQPPAVQPVQAQVASADTMAALPAGTSKGDRLDASVNPPAGAVYDPRQSPLSLWSMSPTQTAIEGNDPTLAAPAAPAATQTAAAAPPQPAAPEHHEEHHAAPVQHHARHHHYVRHVHHWRHHSPATKGDAAPGASAKDAGSAAAGSDGTAQPAAPKKFLGLFGG